MQENKTYASIPPHVASHTVSNTKITNTFVSVSNEMQLKSLYPGRFVRLTLLGLLVLRDSLLFSAIRCLLLVPIQRYCADVNVYLCMKENQLPGRFDYQLRQTAHSLNSVAIPQISGKVGVSEFLFKSHIQGVK